VTSVPLARTAGREGAATAATSRPPRWLAALLRIPLAGKIAGANIVVVAAAGTAALAVHATGTDDRRMLLILGLALAGSLAVNLALVVAALRPLRELEATAARVWRGDLDARVQSSSVADRDVARVGRTLNGLLDGLTADRARMRDLATQVIEAGDRERAHIARELHDSTAQQLTALVLQLAAAARASRDPELAGRLDTIKELAASMMEEVRLLSHTIHPRVLDDLGLAPALENLAHEASGRGPAVVEVVAGRGGDDVPPPAASVLYRVAQESVSNALRHGAPRRVTLRLDVTAHAATLEVADDGCGFDVAGAERRRPGMGLFSMRERVALVEGRFDVASRPSGGTRVTAMVPLGAR
jgi:signal transduction histidine kinase